MEALVWSAAGSLFEDIQPGRLVESLIFLSVLLWRIRPHLKKVEDRMAGVEAGLNRIETHVKEGFKHGEKRFETLERRVDAIENTIGGK